MAVELRVLSKLKYFDPVPVLIRLREIETELDSVDIDPMIHRLRTNQLKTPRDIRNASIFAHGMAAATGHKVYLAAVEASDYDFVTSWQSPDCQHYCPVQLKELAPSDLNPSQKLADVFASLEKYQPTQTALAVLLNKPSQLAVTDLPNAARRFRQIWLFWLASPDGNSWKVQGDVLSDCHTYDFQYPQPAPSAA